MLVRLLGPVDVLVDGAIRPVRGQRATAVLAILALTPGEIVSGDRLVEIVWGDRAPAAAEAALQSQVSRLRAVLGDRTAIRARPPGYVLELGGEATDVRSAERLIRRADASDDPRAREGLLRAAIALFRGRPLVDLAGVAWFDEHAHHLERLLLGARLSLLDAQLALGQHGHLVGELEVLGREHPLDERIHRQLMLALYRAGRQSDALAAYQRLRRTLADELGIAPGQSLRDLEAAILRQEPHLSPPAVAPPAPAPVTIAAQLPLPIDGFAGRAAELKGLDGRLPDPDAVHVGRFAGVSVSVISGTAGVGKTTLAVHWAHRVAARFPDGQLYVNLRGFDPDGSPVDPAAAVRGFLDAFGVPGERIPADLGARVGLYRSLLTDKRILVVLDNARDAEQVRPLLPGTPGCLAVVTSRHQLTGLAATEGAHPVSLDLLSTSEAHDLLAHRLGAARLAAEPQAAAEIVARCARLPLALAIVAARAADRPDFPLATFAAELRDADATLDALRAGDPASDVRAVLSWSYESLSSGPARVFRLLGLHPGPDIGVPAAASLAGLAPGRARAVLAELARAHLVTEPVPGRFSLHDVLRAYATELVHRRDDDDSRRAGTHRLLDHYLHSAHAAESQMHSREPRIALPPPLPGVTPERRAGQEGALAWFTDERVVLVAAIDAAAAGGFDTHAWRLASMVRRYLIRRGLHAEVIATHRTALAAASRAGDRVGQGVVLRGLALGSARAGRLDDAEDLYRQALDLYAGLDDPIGHAYVHGGLAELAERRNRPAEANHHYRRSLDLFHAAGDVAGEALALNGVGWTHALLGRYREAISDCERALAILEDLDDKIGQAGTWDSLGYAHRGLADHRRAVACYRHAIDLYTAVGERHWLADSLNSLGDTHHAAGEADAARAAWRLALTILDDLGHPQAGPVRAKLHR